MLPNNMSNLYISQSGKLYQINCLNPLCGAINKNGVHIWITQNKSIIYDTNIYRLCKLYPHLDVRFLLEFLSSKINK